jgi:hypothetical protein
VPRTTDPAAPPGEQPKPGDQQQPSSSRALATARFCSPRASSYPSRNCGISCRSRRAKIRVG